MFDTNQRPVVTRSAHLAVYLLLGAVFAGAAWARGLRPVVFDGSPGIESELVGRIEQRVDPNSAPWPELARLPGIGEVLARRIVAYRDERGRALASQGSPGPVFSCLEDLRPIRGIGGKRLDQLGGYLKLPAPPGP